MAIFKVFSYNLFKPILRNTSFASSPIRVTFTRYRPKLNNVDRETVATPSLRTALAATRIYRAQVGPNERLPESVAPGVVVLGSQECPWTGKVLQAVDSRFALAQFDTIQEIELQSIPEPEQVLEALRI